MVSTGVGMKVWNKKSVVVKRGASMLTFSPGAMDTRRAPHTAEFPSVAVAFPVAVAAARLADAALILFVLKASYTSVQDGLLVAIASAVIVAFPATLMRNRRRESAAAGVRPVKLTDVPEPPPAAETTVGSASLGPRTAMRYPSLSDPGSPNANVEAATSAASARFHRTVCTGPAPLFPSAVHPDGVEKAAPAHDRCAIRMSPTTRPAGLAMESAPAVGPACAVDRTDTAIG